MPFAFGVNEAKTRAKEFNANAPDCLTIREFSLRVSSVYGKNVLQSSHTKLNLDSLSWSQSKGAFKWSMEQI